MESRLCLKISNEVREKVFRRFVGKGFGVGGFGMFILLSFRGELFLGRGVMGSLGFWRS